MAMSGIGGVGSYGYGYNSGYNSNLDYESWDHQRYTLHPLCHHG